MVWGDFAELGTRVLSSFNTFYQIIICTLIAHEMPEEMSYSKAKNREQVPTMRNRVR